MEKLRKIIAQPCSCSTHGRWASGVQPRVGKSEGAVPGATSLALLERTGFAGTSFVCVCWKLLWESWVPRPR